MHENFENGTAEAQDEGAINPEMGVGPREVLKSFGFRGSAELYIALRELVPAGSLSTAMYIGVCSWHGLFHCRLCGDRLPGDRPKRIVDRWCDECYTIISPEDVRNLVEAMLPPGSKPARLGARSGPLAGVCTNRWEKKNHWRRSSATVNRTKWKPKPGKHAGRNSREKHERGATEEEVTSTPGKRRSQRPTTANREATKREKSDRESRESSELAAERQPPRGGWRPHETVRHAEGARAETRRHAPPGNGENKRATHEHQTHDREAAEQKEARSASENQPRSPKKRIEQSRRGGHVAPRQAQPYATPAPEWRELSTPKGRVGEEKPDQKPDREGPYEVRDRHETPRVAYKSTRSARRPAGRRAGRPRRRARIDG